MKLVIVESPTKARTIKNFLGSKYRIESSFGHIRDLPKTKMGIDIENNFKPHYLIPTKAKKIVKKLQEQASKAEEIILASDEDREGEAIAWHLIKALKIDEKKAKRIVFHEITANAIKNAIKNPRGINYRMVDAQQARRILDRLVGYELSPFLWKKVARGLSAGRVQSVAIRLIVEREREIEAFQPQEYWTLTAKLYKQKSSKNSLPIIAKLNKIDNKPIGKLEIKNKAQIDKITNDLAKTTYQVINITKKAVEKNPPLPFTTSTLQQSANRLLGFSAKQTMMLAQQLYEGLNLGDKSGGLITYMRTDSLNLANDFLQSTKKYIQTEIGDDYTVGIRNFKTKSKGAQEAHEAIRPTDIYRHPDSLKNKLNNNQYRLYRLIWQRALAGQMSPAKLETTTIDIKPKGTSYNFRANGQVLKFPGYLKIYPEKTKNELLPAVEKEEILDLNRLEKEQHFTKPPARYSDAGLVKTLEKYGIGRPSTYAPTIATIIARNYINRDENKKLFPTDIAFVVVDLLVEHFPRIIDYEFTAKMENEFDKIAIGEKSWQPVIKNFYLPFHKNLEKKYQEINKEDIMPEEKSKETCDKCGSPMIIKTGRFGKFLACSAFPKCKNIKSLEEKNIDPKQNEEIIALTKKYKGEICDKCGSPMVIKNGRFGPFLACSAFPKCKNIKSIKENNTGTGVKCPVCGKGEIVQKRSKRGIFYACNQYPDCKNAYWGKPTGEKCPLCGNLLIESKNGKKCANKNCDYIK